MKNKPDSKGNSGRKDQPLGYVVGPGGDFRDLTKQYNPMLNGTNGVGPTIDENYYVERPRSFDVVKAAFKANNPEFKEGASLGDWTSFQWDSNV